MYCQYFFYYCTFFIAYIKCTIINFENLCVIDASYLNKVFLT